MRYLFIILIIVFILMLFIGCFSEKKAQQQFAKAAVAFPKISANYCAFYFPSRDSLIKGDSVLVFDTLYDMSVLTDTLYNKDTVTIIKTLPGKVITKTIHLIDTVYRENTAKIKACEIDKSKLIELLQKKTHEADTWEGKAKTRFYIMWSLILLLVGFLGYKIYSMFKIKP